MSVRGTLAKLKRMVLGREKATKKHPSPFGIDPIDLLSCPDFVQFGDSVTHTGREATDEELREFDAWAARQVDGTAELQWRIAFGDHPTGSTAKPAAEGSEVNGGPVLLPMNLPGPRTMRQGTSTNGRLTDVR